MALRHLFFSNSISISHGSLLVGHMACIKTCLVDIREAINISINLMPSFYWDHMVRLETEKSSESKCI